MNVLETVSFGKSYFKIAISLREAMFLSTVMTNMEVWYGVSKAEVEELEMLDRILLRNILRLPRSTPTEFLYLETGCLNIGTILKMRRINYLQYLLKSDEEKMLSQFFKTQLSFPVKDDWTEQVKMDLEDFQIGNNLDWIKSKSKNSFKRLVKKRAKEYALKLFNVQKSSHSKLDNLYYDELKMQNHLVSKDISVNQVQILMKYRSRMADYHKNYQGKEILKRCILCPNHFDNQEDIFTCDYNKEKLTMVGDYEDLFQERIKPELIRTLEKINKLRENKLR